MELRRHQAELARLVSAWPKLSAVVKRMILAGQPPYPTHRIVVIVAPNYAAESSVSRILNLEMLVVAQGRCQ